MRGELMMRTSPVVSNADRRTARLKLPARLPSDRPIAPPWPVPAGAGKFTTKFGFGTVDAKGERPAVGVWPSVAPPATVTSDGNTRPVGLPVAELATTLPPHWMPTS